LVLEGGVCCLGPREDSYKVIEIKWVFRNKHDEDENINKNKARLVAKGNN